MKTRLMFCVLAILVFASVANAGEKYALDNLNDVPVSRGDVRCGNFVIQTKDASGATSLMFRFSANGQTSLRLVASSTAHITVDESVKDPLVEVPTTQSVIVTSATFTMNTKEAEKARACFPSSTATTAPPP